MGTFGSSSELIFLSQSYHGEDNEGVTYTYYQRHRTSYHGEGHEGCIKLDGATIEIVGMELTRRLKIYWGCNKNPKVSNV